MSNIPSLEQWVIDELVEFWHTGQRPRDLAVHINRMFGAWGASEGAKFLYRVYEDLKIGKRAKYAASSASEFQRFLEAEYRQSSRSYAMSQSEVVVTDVNALNKEMANTTNWTQPAELRPKRKIRVTVCWNCGHHLSSVEHRECSYCTWLICECGSCKPFCSKTSRSGAHNEAVDPFLPDFPDD